VPKNGSLRFLLEADIDFRHACTQQLRGRFHEALRLFRSALRNYSRTNQRLSRIETLLKIGDVSRQIESFVTARKAYRTALLLTARQDTTPMILRNRQDALLGEALCLRGEGKFQPALMRFQICLSEYAKHADEEGRAYVLWALGTTARFAGQFKLAERYLKRSQKIYSRRRDISGLAYALCGLGGTYRMQGRPAESLSCYRRANRTFSRLGDKFGVAYSNCGQSNALRMQNKISLALPSMKKAERLYRSLKLKGPLGFVLWSESQAFAEAKRWKMAAAALQSARNLFRSCGDQRGQLYAKIALADIERRQNRSKYQRVYSEAAKMARKLHLPFEEAHALRWSDPIKARRLYRRCGVRPGFARYRTLP
jgi:tetratricopeptide (TPR) repeat protein